MYSRRLIESRHIWWRGANISVGKSGPPCKYCRIPVHFLVCGMTVILWNRGACPLWDVLDRCRSSLCAGQQFRIFSGTCVDALSFYLSFSTHIGFYDYVAIPCPFPPNLNSSFSVSFCALCLATLTTQTLVRLCRPRELEEHRKPRMSTLLVTLGRRISMLVVGSEVGSWQSIRLVLRIRSMLYRLVRCFRTD